MLFGLCSVPATFERLMETVLRGVTYESYLVYLDVMVFRRTFQEHLLNLRKVFQRFREARLKLNPEKCQLLQKEVRYLEKLKDVREWPIPKDNTKLKHRITWFWTFSTVR
jgi:hypothetical protein